MRIILLFLLFFTSVSEAEVLLQDAHGQSRPVSALQGKWVFINYWAAWCQGCVEEIPELNRFYQQHQKDDVLLFAVPFDNLPLKQQEKIISKFHILYPNLLKDPAKELALGDIIGIPVTFVLNPKGELVETLYGKQSMKTLDQVMKEDRSDNG